MNLITRKVRQLLGFLTIAVTLYNCQTKEVASITPFTYTFKGLEDVKLPAYQPTAPASVTVTPAQVTSSTATAAVTSIVSTSATPSAVQSATQTSAQVTSVLPAAQVSAVAALKPADVVTAARSGNIPASLQTLVSSFRSNPNLAKYLASFTPPSVNGRTVNGRIGVVNQVSVVMATTDDIDACKNTANQAYNQAITALQAASDAQKAQITATYNSAVTNINTQSTSCPDEVKGRYNTLRDAATTAYNAGVTALQTFTNQIADATTRTEVYNGIFAILTSGYVSTMQAYTSAENAEVAACSASKDARIAAAAAARDADLTEVNTNFTQTQTAAAAARDQAVASCHNQGSGK